MQTTKNPPLDWEGRRCTRLVAPGGATFAAAIHLARAGRLAWASAQLEMDFQASTVRAVVTELRICSGKKAIATPPSQAIEPVKCSL